MQITEFFKERVIMTEKKKKASISGVVVNIFLALGALACLAPIMNIVAISLSETSAAATGSVYFWPKEFTLASYDKLITEGTFGRSFMISVLRVIVGTCITIPLTVLMAFPLSKDKKVFRERNIIMWFAVITMLFSGGLIPTYITVQTYGLIDKFWALVLPGALNVFNMILMMNFFRGIPKELDESASMDGAGVWRILLQIYLPVSMPSLVTIVLFTVVNYWNDFFAGMIYINNPDNYPLQTYIRSLTVEIDFTSITDPKELIERLKVSSITFNAAKIVVSMIPILLIYPFLQRYFVTGIVMGAVKE